MRTNKRGIDPRDASATALAVGALLLLSPGRHLWAFASAPWWSPLAVWILLLALGAWIACLQSPEP